MEAASCGMRVPPAKAFPGITARRYSMEKRLNGKIAIITGAGTGIGEAIAHKFAKEGAAVLLNGLPGDPVADVVMRIRSHGAMASGYLGDISEESHARACVQAAIDNFGRLDILINNA